VDGDNAGTKLTEYKVDEDAVASIAMEVGVAKREAEIVRCIYCELLTLLQLFVIS